ncbi:early nodulin-like protein 13 isoform X1 [Raphanus sativus]|uniref:Early nodulin-like protein 13 isoform X1 n=1 Tax=Raphanus sativus TaxID=3726 RepID=A0A6J0MSI6_RAPSA|nr:early nodulin-like protein 13 isoform X1 [Raphanus sativus]
MSTSLMMSCLFLLLCLLCEGREILVGGKSNTWKVPESTEETLNRWSERTRFKIGDSLLWKYNAEKDSVMQVSQKDYERCDRSEPIGGYKDGHTKIELMRSGPFYFISGEDGHCQRGEKLLVVVLSPNHNRSYAADAPPFTAPVTKDKGSSDHVLINQAQRSVATACFLALLHIPLAFLV